MAQRVFFHVGAPKTGTTFLQRVMWANRDGLRAAGVLVPGAEYRDRVWATRTVREMSQPHPRAAGGWDRILRQVHGFDGDAILSHEFFSAATAEQAHRAIASLAPAQVHLVYTARDLTRVLPAMWQERLKYRFTGELDSFEPEPLSADPARSWSWRTIDAADVLRRWAASLPPARVHVVTVPPPPAPRDLLWRRFAEACCFDPDLADLDLPIANESMGLVESELLRRVNPRIGDEISGIGETPVWVRDYLGVAVLASRQGEPISLDQASHERTRVRAIAMVGELRAEGYDVVGDLDELVGPEQARPARRPAEVSDAELLDVSLDVVARMLSDYREARNERDQLRRELRAARRELRATKSPADANGTFQRRVRRLSRRIMDRVIDRVKSS